MSTSFSFLSSPNCTPKIAVIIIDQMAVRQKEMKCCSLCGGLGPVCSPCEKLFSGVDSEKFV